MLYFAYMHCLPRVVCGDGGEVVNGGGEVVSGGGGGEDVSCGNGCEVTSDDD